MESTATPPPSSPPPPMSPPPIITPAASPTPPRRGHGWMIVSIILLAILLVSLFGNFSQWVSGFMRGKTPRVYTRNAGPRLDEVTLEDNGVSAKIAVVEVDGLISSREFDQGGYNMVDLIRAQLDRAKDDRHVRAVILKVDSPGGEVLASDEIYRAIQDFEKADEHGRPGKPVIASMGNLAASGGYYVSAPCRWIVANEMTITGSIGVIMHSWNYRHLIDKVGISPEVYKSGVHKDMLSGSRKPEEIPADEREMIQSLINEVYGKFTNVVVEGRGYAASQSRDARPLSDDWTNYVDGRILSGTEAYKLGFVDKVGTFDDAVKKAKEIAKIPDADLIQYQQHYNLGDLFRIFGKSEAPVIKVDLGVQLPKLEAGQPYFLSPTLLH